MAINFPTLSRTPNLINYIEFTAFDTTIRTQFANGSIKSRGGTSSTPKVFSFTYSFITAADRTLLQDFERNSVFYGEKTFVWIRPTDNIVFSVKFNKILKFSQSIKEKLWNVNIELMEQF